MYTEGFLKEKLTKLYETNPYIHMDVNLARPHVEMKRVRVKLVGIYRHMFQIEEEKKGKIERRSLQYGEVLAGIVRIAELSESADG